MSKSIKNLMTEMYRNKFADITEAVVVDIRGIGAVDNSRLRTDLAKKSIRIMVVKNTLVQKAFDGTGLEGLGEVIDGPSAMVYGGESVVNVARELVEWAKELKELDLKGAILDGEVFGADEVVKLSKFPTREEAHAKVVQLFLSPAGNVAGAAMGPGGVLASILKTIEEKLEKGETIEKVA